MSGMIVETTEHDEVSPHTTVSFVIVCVVVFSAFGV